MPSKWNDPEFQKQYNRRYYLSRREELLRKGSEYRAVNGALISKRKKKAYREDPRVRARLDAYRAANRDSIYKSIALSAQMHPEWRKKARANWLAKPHNAAHQRTLEANWRRAQSAAVSTYYLRALGRNTFGNGCAYTEPALATAKRAHILVLRMLREAKRHGCN